MRQLVRSMNRPNLPELGDIFPDYEAPVFRKVGNGVELTMLRWGVPLPSTEGRRPKLVTNVRNTASPFWRSMLANPERRCLVPVSAFSEWTSLPDPATGKKRLVWFDVKDTALFAFAGIWRSTGDGERFAFLTCEPNELVAPIRPKAMPVILDRRDYDQWLSADFDAACALQRPFPASAMRIANPAAAAVTA